MEVEIRFRRWKLEDGQTCGKSAARRKVDLVDGSSRGNLSCSLEPGRLTVGSPCLHNTVPTELLLKQDDWRQFEHKTRKTAELAAPERDEMDVWDVWGQRDNAVMKRVQWGLRWK